MQQLVQQTREVISSSFSLAKKSLEAMSFSEILKIVKVPKFRGAFSNDYLQTGTVPDKFCAMGSVYHELGWNGKYGSGTNWRDEDFLIISDQLGLDAKIRDHIAYLNDVEDWNFETIAEDIEVRGI